MENGAGREPVSSELRRQRAAGAAKRPPWSLGFLGLAPIGLLLAMNGVGRWDF